MPKWVRRQLILLTISISNIMLRLRLPVQRLLDMEKQLEQTSVTRHQVKYASLNVTHPHVPIMIKLNLLSCDVEHHIIFQSLVTKHYFYYMVT
jgi:hypothetical protein